MESDEAYAQSLDTEASDIEAIDTEASAPLIAPTAPTERSDTGAPRQQPDQVELTTNRVALTGLLIISLPQIIAISTVLSLHWNPSPLAGSCNPVVLLKWRVWSLVGGVRLVLHLFAIFSVVIGARFLGRESRLLARLQTLRTLLDFCGMLWFLVGNLWLFGDDAKACHHRGNDPAFRLALVILAVQYGQLCLPCLMAVILLPIFCLCLPCIIRWLRRLQARREASKGATEATIQALPTRPFQELCDENGADLDSTCPICLVDFEPDEALRVLPCKHHFHLGCVDEWLSKNSTCPSCRGDVNTNTNRPDAGSGIELTAVGASP
jgi:E3 ubiquitin-protein ligase RNF38/44